MKWRILAESLGNPAEDVFRAEGQSREGNRQRDDEDIQILMHGVRVLSGLFLNLVMVVENQNRLAAVAAGENIFGVMIRTAIKRRDLIESPGEGARAIGPELKAERVRHEGELFAAFPGVQDAECHRACGDQSEQADHEQRDVGHGRHCSRFSRPMELLPAAGRARYSHLWDMCGMIGATMRIGFKEWALVCEALGRGTQSVILRKGGIAEGREGFRFKHEEFFLFPTWFHEQLERTTLPADTPLPKPMADTVRIELFARVLWTELVDDLARAKALAPFHVLKPGVVEERFHYDEAPGIHAACVRVYRMATPWEFPMRLAYGGCRSWIDLPDAPRIEMHPVLSDAAHAEREAAIREAISRTSG